MNAWCSAVRKEESTAMDTSRSAEYFGYAGEVNTDRVIRAALNRALELGIRSMVVASETGVSALKAARALNDSGVQLVVVTHFPAKVWGPRGDIPTGLMREEYAARRHEIESHGARIVLGTRPFAPPSRSLGWSLPTPEAIIDKSLEVFGPGTKIAIEAAIMATDAGAVSEGEEVVSCGGTLRGLDTALVVRAAYSMDFFRQFDVLELVAKPRCRVKTMPEFESPGWKGDLSQYYPSG